MFPEEFTEKYSNILAKEAPAFFQSFDQEPVSAFRVNPLKKVQKTFDNPIHNTRWGYYGKISGKSPEHATGLVYSQEPAAQMVVQVASPQKNMKILDLAAAPGGKSTHLLSYLENTGLLVSNEISTKRSKVLVENIERFGARNVVVTNESAANLSRVFNDYFDLIVFDGPCSGEGMFRKDPNAISYWSEQYPTECSLLQKDILKDTLKMLKPGGKLVYSTCTWSLEENEDVVNWLLENYPYLEVMNVKKLNGMVSGIELEEVARMYPHHFRGEGQFVAVLRDNRPISDARITLKNKKNSQNNLKKDQAKLWQAFQKESLSITLEGQFDVFGQELYLVPKGLPDMSRLKIARNGLHLGTFKKNRFEPSFALGLALTTDDVVQFIEIDIEQYKDYVQGRTITLSKTYSNGWYQVTVNGNGLGFAKVVGNVLKNYYPKGLRFQA
ncbi:putative ribosomal RNA large subunit methyltransferase J [Streptococcus urinalis 2285-97]|uniref:Ribosomal RNA large subunit methyltransferase J n=1 Tax=Streptococcus urinalis 2285-97 TaxID=764291 RepID=G5KGA6_9STRE|nr:putative ribosomal RNA large subunit methyltransferase J [Streptococcus urinalis 2285-97]